MLSSLFIKNYAIIDSLEIDWPSGFSVITGETGAGKSIMIGALQFVLGARTDTKVVRNSEEKCIVEVRFNELKDQQKILSEFDFLDHTDEIIIRREILPNGRSRSFINDSPVTAQELNQLSAVLISIHQQFDLLDILYEDHQINLLDSYIGHNKQVSDYKNQFKVYRKSIEEINELKEEQRKLEEERDYIMFQLSELDQLNLIPGEYSKLEEELSLALKSEEIINNTGLISSILEGEKGVIDQLQDVSGFLRPLISISAVAEINERIQSLREDLKDITYSLQKVADKTEFDKEKISNLQMRFDLITRALKKHRVETDVELLEIREKLEVKSNTFSNLEEKLQLKEKELQKIHSELMQAAKLLSKKRKEICKKFDQEAVGLLNLLGMEFAQFNTQLVELKELNETGLDEVTFNFSANKGANPKPLKNQASGGELSRLNLVLKSMVSSEMKMPTMIFDEIDTGVSGQIALQMGNILKNMSAHHQIITITHSPQVASRAKNQFYVYKDSSSKSTITKLKKLEKQERMYELAKMLSGDPPSASAIKNANELMSSSN